MSCVSHRATQRSPERKGRTERESGVQSAAARDLRINRILHRITSYSLLSILLLFSAGVDLWRHEPIVWFLWSLLSADGDQRPWSHVHFGAVGNSRTRLPASLQLHCLEPLRHRHRPGHPKRARYMLTPSYSPYQTPVQKL